MLTKDQGQSAGKVLLCRVCDQETHGVGSGLGICPVCLRQRWKESQGWIQSFHDESRRIFRLPLVAPRTEGGLACRLCFHQCVIGKEETGYCGVRTGTGASFRRDGRLRARVSHYFDPLPTNCVADWVCAGGTGCGYPQYAHDRGPEVGFYNLAVFFEACNFNCLSCQNWHFKHAQSNPSQWTSLDELVKAVNEQTSCVCYFGGDPAPQAPYALRASEQMFREYPGQILRICWETNGSVHPAYLKRMAHLSLDSGGCMKVDLKAWNSNIHRSLCGCDNRQVLENFARLAQWGHLRPDPPFLVASTLMVPGYVDEEEIFHLASFIASFSPDIPYTLLGFAPQFFLDHLPTTSLAQAEACLDAAKRAGLRRVRVGNRHLLS